MERRKQSTEELDIKDAQHIQEDKRNTFKMPTLKRQSLAGNFILPSRESKILALEGPNRDIDTNLFHSEKRFKYEHPWFIKTKLKGQTLKRFESMNPFTEYKLKLNSQRKNTN